MTTFLALYRGQTVNDAKMIAVTADPSLITLVATRLLVSPPETASDPVAHALEQGRRAALRLITREGHDADA